MKSHKIHKHYHFSWWKEHPRTWMILEVDFAKVAAWKGIACLDAFFCDTSIHIHSSLGTAHGFTACQLFQPWPELPGLSRLPTCLVIIASLCLTGAFHVGNERMIQSIPINNNPVLFPHSHPFPSIPCVKRTRYSIAVTASSVSFHPSERLGSEETNGRMANGQSPISGEYSMYMGIGQQQTCGPRIKNGFCNTGHILKISVRLNIYIRRFPEIGVPPVIVHFSMGFSLLHQPFGVPPWLRKPPRLFSIDQQYIPTVIHHYSPKFTLSIYGPPFQETSTY